MEMAYICIYALFCSAEAHLVTMWIAGVAALTVERLNRKELLSDLNEILNMAHGRETTSLVHLYES